MSVYLVDEILEVLIGEGLPRSDDPVHVGLHEVRDDVDVLEVGRVRGDRHDVGDGDDVLVAVEVPEQLDLPDDALGVHQVAEHVADLLDRYLPPLDLIGRDKKKRRVGGDAAVEPSGYTARRRRGLGTILLEA